MKLTYRQKLTVSFCAVFAVFTIGTIVLEQYRARRYKTEALEERLDAYADIAGQGLTATSDSLPVGILDVLPRKLRITWIDGAGNLLYDNRLEEISAVDNHAERPEVARAREHGMGRDIRISASNNEKYLYYAKRLGSGYIRVALPYDIQVRHLLKPDPTSVYYVIAIFAVVLFFVSYISGRFGRSIKKLRDFSVAAGSDTIDIGSADFPDDELGEIGAKIVKDYKQLRENERNIALEKEKLLQHVQSSAEGICFFSADGTPAFHNGLFMQYLNTLTDNIALDPAQFMREDIFAEVRGFIAERSGGYFETQIFSQGKYFFVRVNVFDDGSFEVVLNDITRLERTHRLKQEMTGNIAHELRTPVACIRGFLETILLKKMEPERQKQYLDRIYDQVVNLSEIIHNMSLLTKMDEVPDGFALKEVDVARIIDEVRRDLDVQLSSKGIKIESDIPSGTLVMGNESLVYSIFRNLTDNVIYHAGEGVTITIGRYDQDDEFAYFSFADNGKGIVDEEHINRLFERFYRVDKGRTRDAGGSGLGLSIVKNAVAFHRGTITVKNRRGGGLEFLFNLAVK